MPKKPVVVAASGMQLMAVRSFGNLESTRVCLLSLAHLRRGAIAAMKTMGRKTLHAAVIIVPLSEFFMLKPNVVGG